MDRAVIVGLITPNQTEEQTNEYLDELEFLALTNDIHTYRRFVQKVDMPDSNTYIGSGKLETIRQYVTDYNKTIDERQEAADTIVTEVEYISVIIFDDELSPRQLRNIEKILGATVRILDRTRLILDIFMQRAQTSYAKTQVELAHWQYMLPRLTRLWTHLDRQRGGGTVVRGQGETQMEADKRIIGQRIALLKENLKKIDKQMTTQRQNRGKLVRVALVGYTNVGKSTLMNLLSKTEVLVENKLFATLDTTVRKITIANLPFLLSDTVGFIRKLPHHLIESFKSTLDEVREADLLLHIVDISHPNFEEQYEVVLQTLNQICSDSQGKSTLDAIPSIVVFNKIDNYHFTPPEEDDLMPSNKQGIMLDELKKTWMSRLNQQCVFISAKNKHNIDELKQMLYSQVKAIHVKRYPYNDFLYVMPDF